MVPVRFVPVVPAGLVALALAGCASREVSPEVCANGACDAVPDCQLGICPDDPPLLSRRPRSAAAPSPGMATATTGPTAAGCPFSPDEIPPVHALLDDSSIPEFRRDRRRASNRHQGNAFLQDAELHDHLLGIQASLFECLDLAACYHMDAPGTGELEFEFELEPDGRVSGVSVTPSSEIDQPVVRACARRSVFEARFPSWNGSRMIVSYSVQIYEPAT